MDRIGPLKIKRHIIATRPATDARYIEQLIDWGDAVVEVEDVTFTHRVTCCSGCSYLVEAEEIGDRNPNEQGFDLLQEALDWIGLENMTVMEEQLSLDLQHRIARFLARVREYSENRNLVGG